MNTQDDKGIEELVEQKLEGKSYSKIREELSREGLSEDKIHRLIRQVDERVLKEEVEGSQPDRARQIYLGGLVLAIAGLLVSVAFNLGIILQKWPAMLVYTPFLLGILAMLISKRMPRREKPDSPGTGSIRRQRPYK